MTALPRALSVYLMAALIGACGGPSKEKEVSAPQTVSRLFGVALHPSSILENDKSGPDREIYHVQIPVAGLATYYEVVHHMGGGAPFRDYLWCDERRVGSPLQTFERVWRQEATSNFLILEGFADKAGSVLKLSRDTNSDRVCHPSVS